MIDIPHTAAVRFQEETLPAYDRSHGTPNPMVRRILVFELPQGAARWEQSDYGHPGRFIASATARSSTVLGWSRASTPRR